MNVENQYAPITVLVESVGDGLRDAPTQHHPALDGIVNFVWEHRNIVKRATQEPAGERKPAVSGIRLEPGYRPDMVFALAAEKYKIGPYLTPTKIAQMMAQESIPSVLDYGNRAYNDVSEKGAESVYHLGLTTRSRFFALKNAGTITYLRELARTNPGSLSAGMRGEIITKLNRFDSQVEMLNGFRYGYEDVVTANARMEERIRRLVPTERFPLSTSSSAQEQV